jgi:F-type H+-transporting ATPase subunit b
MSELVHQIGELFLRAVPVALIVLVFYIVMRVLFFKPLLKVMAERNARTQGAQKAAETAQAAAAEKVKQFEDALKQARAKVYGEQEAEVKKVQSERESLLRDARASAAAEVTAGRERVGGEFAAAKKELQTNLGTLSSEIAQRVLQPARPNNPTSEAR